MISKFTRRHKAPLTVAAGFILLLLAGAAASAWQAARARNAETLAVANERKALEAAETAKHAKDAEADQRRQAEASEKLALQEKNSTLAAKEELRHTLYASEMNLVQAAWDSGQYRRVAQLLESQRPAAGQSDLRGFEWHYWKRRLELGRLGTLAIPKLAEVPPLEAAGGMAARIGFAGEGSLLAAVVSATTDPAQPPQYGLMTWETVTGRERHAMTMLPAPAPITRPAFAPPLPASVVDFVPTLSVSDDGSTVAVTTRDRILIFDGHTGEQRGSFPNPGMAGVWLRSETVLSPDGTRLARTATTLASFPRTTSGAFPGSFGPAGFSGARSRLALLQNPAVQEELSLADDQKAKVRTLYRGRSGPPPVTTNVATRESARTEILDTSSGDVVCSPPSLEGTAGTNVWSPDGKRLLRQAYTSPTGAGRERQFHTQLVDASTGEEIWVHDSTSPHFPRAWSPDGSLIAVAAPGGTEEETTLQLWDAHTGTTLAILNRGAASYNYERNFAFSPDGKRLAAASMLNEIYIWEVPQLEVGADSQPLRVRVPASVLKHGGELVRALSFSADSRRLYGVAGTSLITWDAAVRQDAWLGDADFRGSAVEGRFSPDSTRFAVGQSIWDVDRDREVCRLENDGRVLLAFAFSADAQRVAAVKAGSRPIEIAVNDAVSGKLLTTISAGGISLGPVFSAVSTQYPEYGLRVRTHPGGSQVATVVAAVSAERKRSCELKAWDAQTGRQQWSASIDTVSAYAMDYSPDGASIAVAAQENQRWTVVFFDSATGERQRTLEVPGIPKWVDFRSQSIAAVTATDILLYDPATGAERMRLRGHDGIDHHAISPDGRRLAVSRSQIARRQDTSEISLWSLESGQRLLTIVAQGQTGDLCFAADGHRLMASYRDELDGKPIRVWDATPLPDESTK